MEYNESLKGALRVECREMLNHHLYFQGIILVCAGHANGRHSIEVLIMSLYLCLCDYFVVASDRGLSLKVK